MFAELRETPPTMGGSRVWVAGGAGRAQSRGGGGWRRGRGGGWPPEAAAAQAPATAHHPGVAASKALEGEPGLTVLLSRLSPSFSLTGSISQDL